MQEGQRKLLAHWLPANPIVTLVCGAKEVMAKGSELALG